MDQHSRYLDSLMREGVSSPAAAEFAALHTADSPGWMLQKLPAASTSAAATMHAVEATTHFGGLAAEDDGAPASPGLLADGLGLPLGDEAHFGHVGLPADAAGWPLMLPDDGTGGFPDLQEGPNDWL